MQQKTVTILDLYGKMSHIEGQLTTIVQIAPQVTENKEQLIRYDERIKRLEDSQKDTTKTLKEQGRSTQKILIAIGVAAVLAQFFFQILASKGFL